MKFDEKNAAAYNRLGILYAKSRKYDEAVEEWSVENVLMCADRQKEILSNAAECVAQGGYLLYSTCTLVREENEGVVEAFLRAHPNFTTEPLPLPAPFPKNESGMLALVPGEYDTDGFFICRLRRKA